MAAAGALLGQGATITQDAKTLTVTRTTQNGEVKSVYNLDGSESKNSAPGRGGAMMESTSLTKWDGNKLVITTSTSFNGNPITSTTTLWLDTSGNPPRGDAASNFNGGAATTTTMTYKKS